MTIRPAIAVAVAFEVAFVGLLALQDSSWQTSPVASEIGVLVAAVIAAAACIRAGRTAPDRRGGWALIAGALAMWSTANALRAERLRDGLEAGFVPIADVLGLVAPIVAIVGVLTLCRSLSDRSNRVRLVLDGSLVAAASLFAMWALAPEIPSPPAGRSRILEIVVMAHPGVAVAAAAIAALALARSRKQERPTLGLVAAGLVMVALADGTLSEASVAGVDLPRVMVLGAWLAAYLFFGLAAVQPAPPPAKVAIAFDDIARAPMSTLLLPYIPLVAAGAVAAFRLLIGWPFDARLTADGLLLISLVVSRQLVSLFDNRRLVRSLHSTVKELRQRERELRHQALHDGLTGLANRLLFFDRVQHAMARSRRRNGRPPAVLYLDLDGFKDVNDHFGHATGDLLLVRVAERLRSCVRADETVARLGGDEFALVIDDADGRAAHVVAKRLLDVLTQPYELGDVKVTLGASIGIAHAEPDADTVDTIVRRADACMYRAKAGGKGQVVDDRMPPADDPVLTPTG